MVTHVVGTLVPTTDAPAPVTQTSQAEQETLPTSMVTHVVGPLTPGITLVKKHIFFSTHKSSMINARFEPWRIQDRRPEWKNLKCIRK